MSEYRKLAITSAQKAFNMADAQPGSSCSGIKSFLTMLIPPFVCTLMHGNAKLVKWGNS